MASFCSKLSEVWPQGCLATGTQNLPIHTLVDQQALHRLEASAVDAHDGSFPYTALSTMSTQLAWYFHHTYFLENEFRVALLMEKSAMYPVVLLAILKAGGVFVPLDPSQPKSRLNQLLDEVNPSFIITSPKLYDQASTLCGRVFVVDKTALVSKKLIPSILPTVTGKNAAYIIFTSGSTGKAKGVVVEHSAFVASALARGTVVGLSPDSRVLQYAAHTFDVSVDEIFTTLIHGGCVCIPSETDRFNLGESINKLRVNHALLTATSANMLNPTSVPGLQTLQLGGELLSQETISKWIKSTTLFNVYGPTEASVACAIVEVLDETQSGRIIGRPTGSVCRIVDPQNHNKLLAANTVGELIIGGKILAREYWNDASRTKDSFIHSPSWDLHHTTDAPSRFYKTGDLAEMDETGLISIRGRKDNQIKIRGQRINVEEIEGILKDIIWVQSVIVARPERGPFKGKLVAIVSTILSQAESEHFSRGSHSETSQFTFLSKELSGQAYEKLEKLLPIAMIPSVWVELPSLPQTSSSKTDRRAINCSLEDIDDLLHKSMMQPDGSYNHSALTHHNIDPKYLDILSQVLGRETRQLQVHDSFIRNGGDSIMAMDLRRQGQQAGLQLQIRDILSPCSLGELVRMSMSAPGFQEPIAKLQDGPGCSFALSPVQRFFFDVIVDERDSFTQSIDLQLKETFPVDELKAATDTLVSTHAMLRARFKTCSDGWEQIMPTNVEGSYSFTFRKAQHADGSASQTDPKLSIEFGPIFHVGVTEHNCGRQSIRLVAHHLAVDLVSWRIMLQDLEKILRGDSLPYASMSFQSWCYLQKRYAMMLDPNKALTSPVQPDNCAYWWPQDGFTENTHGLAETCSFSLNPWDTDRIMNFNSGIRPVEIVLGAFYNAFMETIPGRDNPTIYLESHGREPWHPSIDISSTVGWFTTAYPITVPAELSHSLWSAIVNTRDTLRSVPKNGLPYWCHRFLGHEASERAGKSSPMEWVFNFAGQFHHVDRSETMFIRRSAVGKETAHRNAQRLSLFDILASIEDSKLDFVVSFPSTIQHKDKVSLLILKWQENLSSTNLVQPDIASSILSVQNPEDVLRTLEGSEIDIHNHIQHAYWASGLQESILSCQSQNSLYYRVRGTWTLKSSDFGAPHSDVRLHNAWAQVVDSHPALRTVFMRSPVSGRFLAVILGDISSSGLAVKECLPILSNSPNCVQDFPLSNNKTPVLPHSLVVHEVDGNSICFSLLFSHSIIDASSRTIILEDLINAYNGQTPPREANAYMEHLDQTKESSVLLRPETIGCIFPASLKAHENASAGVCSTQIVAPGYYTANIVQQCRQRGVTISSLIFTAWSLVLHKYVSQNQVSFAYVKSNRLMEATGSARRVGLYVDLFILSVDLGDQRSLWEICRDIQQSFATDALDGIPPPQASGTSNNDHSPGLVNKMVNIRNVGDGNMEFPKHNASLGMISSEDPWDVSTLDTFSYHSRYLTMTLQYDLVLAVDVRSSDSIKCSIDYRTASVAPEVAANVANTLGSVLDALLQNEDLTRERLGSL